ncbi:MAG: DISARM system phospholipase D-like protein DrmC [Longimicrobiales bacterium]|nr:DISARM system phospholipase D-like protein DrmC [Longimicrobiales bacterium]
MIGVLSELPRPALLGLADGLGSGRVVPPYDTRHVAAHVPTHLVGDICATLDSLHADGMSPGHIALLLRTLAEERGRVQARSDSTELVWSGPEVPGMRSRDTSVVAREMFRRAERDVLLATYAVDAGTKARAVLGGLCDRMEEKPNLRVRLFINVPRKFGDQAPAAELVREFAERFRTSIWPGGRLPEVFYDPRSLAIGGSDRASLHAKCVIVDAKVAFVTSANLTDAAHARNIEAGVLVSDPAFARGLASQFETLVERGLLVGML